MKNLIIIISVILVLLFIYAISCGLLYSPKMKSENLDGFAIAYITKRGDYKYTMEAIEQVKQTFKENKIKADIGFGMYYDDPKIVEEHKRRYIAGVIITQEQYNLLSKADHEKISFALIDPGYSVLSGFPYRSSMSIMLAVFKVYPKLSKYIQDSGITNKTIIEIYDKKKKEIVFICSYKNDFKELIE